MTDLQVTTPDGRVLQVLETGVPDGVPVVFLEGMPNSRLVFGPWAALAAQKGIRLISYDRPGYGGSDPFPGRTVADCEIDLRAIAAALGIDRMGAYGVSGGGPHALAVAALMADLVPAVVVLGSPAPWGAAGLDYLAGMGERNVEVIQLYFEDREAARARCESKRKELIAVDAEQLLESWETLLAPVDRAQLSGDLAEFFIVSLRDGLSPGSEGWWEDDVATKEHWGFELNEIRTPVLLMHGHQDRFVPVTHGQWLADHIPGVDARISEADGHLSLSEGHLPEIFDWLLERV